MFGRKARRTALENLARDVAALVARNAELELTAGEVLAHNRRLLDEHKHLRATNTRLNDDLARMRDRLRGLGDTTTEVSR